MRVRFPVWDDLETQASEEVSFKGKRAKETERKVGIWQKYPDVQLKGYSNANFESDFSLRIYLTIHLREIGVHFRVNILNIERFMKLHHQDNNMKGFLLLLFPQ